MEIIFFSLPNSGSWFLNSFYDNFPIILINYNKLLKDIHDFFFDDYELYQIDNDEIIRSIAGSLGKLKKHKNIDETNRLLDWCYNVFSDEGTNIKLLIEIKEIILDIVGDEYFKDVFGLAIIGKGPVWNEE